MIIGSLIGLIITIPLLVHRFWRIRKRPKWKLLRKLILKIHVWQMTRGINKAHARCLSHIRTDYWTHERGQVSLVANTYAPILARHTVLLTRDQSVAIRIARKSLRGAPSINDTSRALREIDRSSELRENADRAQAMLNEIEHFLIGLAGDLQLATNADDVDAERCTINATIEHIVKATEQQPCIIAHGIEMAKTAPPPPTSQKRGRVIYHKFR